MKFDLGEVLTRARQITWRYKNFWLAGIAISLVSLLLAPISLALNPAFSSFAVPPESNQPLPFVRLADVSAILLAILSIPIFVIGISIPLLGTLQIEQGSENVHFGQLLRGVLPYFWRISGIVVLVLGGMFLALMLLIVFSFSVTVLTLGLGLLCVIPLFILLVLMAILGYALMEQGVSAVLVDHLRVSSALQRAWELVQKNIGVMTPMSLMNYVIAMVAIMIISLPMIPMSNPGAGLNVRPLARFSGNMIWWIVAFLPIYVVVQGIILTFLQSVWMLIYLHLTRSATRSQPLPRTGEAVS